MRQDTGASYEEFLRGRGTLPAPRIPIRILQNEAIKSFVMNNAASQASLNVTTVQSPSVG